MTLIPIDKNIPVPAKRMPNPPKYPWKHMEAGDSIRVPGLAMAARRSASVYGKTTGRTFTARKVGRHTRIWRTA